MSSRIRRLDYIALSGISEINLGDNIAEITLAAAEACGETVVENDIIIIAQKIVSKVEGRVVDITATLPSPEAINLANKTNKDAKLVQHILEESTEIVRAQDGLIIARHRNGWVVANAGIDLSNAGGEEKAILLPIDPDLSAKKIAQDFRNKSVNVGGVVVNDSMGRAWRKGTVGVSIGSYGIEALQDRRGQKDRDNKILESSEIAIADEIAAAGSLLMGQGDEGLPIVILRGLNWAKGSGEAASLVRQSGQDLFK